MNCWHIQNKELFRTFRQGINDNYTTLNVIIENNIVFIRGTLRLKDKNGKEIDSYLIEIEIPHNYPKEAPRVRETGGRLPRTLERHTNGDGTVCLYFRDEVYRYWNEGSIIIDFIKNVVEGFFLWQTEYDLTGGKNKNESWDHGVKGVKEFYGNILGTKDLKIIYRFVEYLSQKKIKGHWNCFCGSGKKMRECHFDVIKKYKKKIKRKDARKSLDDFKKDRKIVQVIKNKVI